MPDEPAGTIGGADATREGPTADSSQTGLSVPRVPGEAAGARIGPYKLLELIGEGGFGSVFLAEQERPVQRRVALKIIKLGMDTRAVIARFEAERQALAMMDHPNIARVLDAGATESGRPFFVMELVRGEPITAFCDRRKLPIGARLELFAQVCAAVQHAHTKGIIHRDIKPSNVLVSEQDDRALAKVIDFGIAKATASRLTEKTVFTQQQQIIGTPEYMSPEQALGSQDIDTRTDVYSLGVLLYELLTGSTPFSGAELRSAAYDEIRRIIREVEPPRPSTRLSQNAATVATVAALRQSEPRKLGLALRGDLDWIVMKALEKDRTRRYETANGLASDVRRYLAGEAVLAAPPGAGYRLGKFVRRHRVMVAAGGVVAAALMLGAGVSAWFAVSEARQRAEAERQRALAEEHGAAEAKARARAEAINRFVTKALVSSDPLQTGSKDITIAQAMESAVREIESGVFRNEPETEAGLQDTIGLILKNNGRYKEAGALLERAIATRERVLGSEAPALAISLQNLGNLRYAEGRYPEAEPFYQRALAILEKARGPVHRDVAGVLTGLAALYYTQGNYAEAEALHLRALGIKEKILSPDDRDLALTLNDLALLYSAQGRYPEAEAMLKRALAINEKQLGQDHPDVAAILNSLALLYEERAMFAEAQPCYERALAICEKSLGPEHPIVATAMLNLAELYRRQGQFAKAEPLYTRALAIREKVQGPEHAEVSIVLNNLGLMYSNQGSPDKAEPLLRRSLAIDEKNVGPDHPDVAATLNNLAVVYEAQGRPADAEAAYLRALAIRERALGPDSRDAAVSANNLGGFYRSQGRYAEAEPLVERALATLRKLLDPDHPDLAAVTATLARVHHSLGKTAQARQEIDGALATLRKRWPGGSPTVARVLWMSGVMRMETSDSAPALPELEEAVAMAEKLLPPENPRLKEYGESLAKCKAALGRGR